mmetsp:Transcript_28564/g.58975  ORF Transcript_28564/g.58975 Transcript_28564/m.58975 type:complete len:243 (-) Transcript_28564:8-736(-)
MNLVTEVGACLWRLVLVQAVDGSSVSSDGLSVSARPEQAVRLVLARGCEVYGSDLATAAADGDLDSRLGCRSSSPVTVWLQRHFVQDSVLLRLSSFAFCPLRLKRLVLNPSDFCFRIVSVPIMVVLGYRCIVSFDRIGPFSVHVRVIYLFSCISLGRLCCYELLRFVNPHLPSCFSNLSPALLLDLVLSPFVQVGEEVRDARCIVLDLLLNFYRHDLTRGQSQDKLFLLSRAMVFTATDHGA